MTKRDEQEDDPYLEDVLDDAMGPLMRLLPAPERERMREALREAVRDDPTLSDLYAAARPRERRPHSGETDAHPELGARDDSAATRPAKRKGGAA